MSPGDFMQSKTRVSLLVVSILLAGCSSGSIKPFTSDGCSSFPDGTFEQSELWLQCCIAHDLSYWKGGTYADRIDADQELQMCVTQVGEPEIATLMLAGVRVGGSPLWPTSFRWGYGWSYLKWYGELTEDELKQIQALETVVVEKPK